MTAYLKKHGFDNLFFAAAACSAFCYLNEFRYVAFGWGLQALITFILFWFFFGKTSDMVEKKQPSEAAKKNILAVNIFSALMTFCCAAYYTVKPMELEGVHENAYFVFGGVCVLVGCFVFIRRLMTLVFRFTEGKISSVKEYPKVSSKKVFALSFFVLLLGFGFYYALKFPGYPTRDTLDQVLMSIEMKKLVTHHPVIHTKLLGYIYVLGIALFGDERGGIGLYTAVQVVLYAACNAYLVSTMYATGFKKKFWVATLVVNAIFSPIGYFTIVDCKDVFAAGGMIVFLCCLWRILKGKSEKKDDALPWYKKNYFNDRFFEYLGVFVFGLVTALFRSGGKYVILATFVMSLILLYRKNKRIIALIAAIIPLTYYIQGPIYTDRWKAEVLTGGKKDHIEMLSVPVMQVASVVASGAPLTEKERQLIEFYADEDTIRETYYKDVMLADGIKEIMKKKQLYEAPEHIEKNAADYLKLYIALGLRHPVMYVRQWVLQTSSYWMPGCLSMVYFSDRFNVHLMDELPDLTIFGYKAEERVLWLLDLYKKIPALGIIYEMPLYTWAVLFSFFVLVLRLKRNTELYDMIFYVPLGATYFMLLIGSPIWRDTKYLEPILSIFIFLCAIPFYRKPSDNEEIHSKKGKVTQKK